MKKSILALTLLAALAPALLVAQDNAVQEVANPQEQYQKLQADYSAQMEKLQQEQQAKLAKLRAEQEAKMAEMRAEEEARIREEQERIAKIRAERNEKIADLQSQLMALEVERANDVSMTGAHVGHGMTSAAPMIVTAPQAAPQPAMEMSAQSVIVEGTPMAAPIMSMPAPVMSAPVPMIHSAPVMAAPVIAAPVIAAPVIAAPVLSAPAVPPVLTQIYGPPVVMPARGCLSGKCGLR